MSLISETLMKEGVWDVFFLRTQVTDSMNSANSLVEMRLKKGL